MAPGCFSQSAKETSSNTATATNNNNNNEAIETNNKNVTLADSNGYGTMKTTTRDDKSYQIPLPLGPPPSSSLADGIDASHADTHDRADSDSDSDDESDSEDEEEEHDEEADLNEKVDSFEVLEQTIIKQKRLARLKNTDLRRKVLLKCTFDLVCEIMDTENGFNNEDDTDDDTVALLKSETDRSSQEKARETEKDAKKIVSDEEESDDDDDDDDEIEEDSHGQLELELHDHTKMDDDDEIEENESIESPITTTIVKLVDVAEPLLISTSTSSSSSSSSSIGSAQVPRHQCSKRRSSSDDDENEDDDDEYLYEYSMNHINDQQLNYRRMPQVSMHPADFHMYSDTSSPSKLNAARSKMDESISRSNHARKKIRT